MGHEAVEAGVVRVHPVEHPLVGPPRVVLLLQQLEHLLQGELRVAEDEEPAHLPVRCWAAKDRPSTILASR